MSNFVYQRNKQILQGQLWELRAMLQDFADDYPTAHLARLLAYCFKDYLGQPVPLPHLLRYEVKANEQGTDIQSMSFSSRLTGGEPRRFLTLSAMPQPKPLTDPTDKQDEYEAFTASLLADADDDMSSTFSILFWSSAWHLLKVQHWTIVSVSQLTKHSASIAFEHPERECRIIVSLDYEVLLEDWAYAKSISKKG